MPRERVTIYLVKHLGWAYNDECTVPHCATFEKAFRTRERAELYRRELELGLCGNAGPNWDSNADEPRRFVSDWGEPRIRE